MTETRVGYTEMVVTIVGTAEDGTIMYRDPLGTTGETTARIRGKTGSPAPGEQWMLVRHGNLWVPEFMMNAPLPAPITGTRDGLSPVVTQMLDAMAGMGLIVDETTPVTTSPVVDDVPPAEDPGYEEIPSDTDPTDPGYNPEVDNPPVDPSYDDGTDQGPTGREGMDPSDAIPKPPKKATSTPPKQASTPAPAYLPTWVASFNVKVTRSNRAILQDLIQITRTKAEIICCQEFGHSWQRDIFPHMTARGWAVSAPGNTPNPIFWDSSIWERMDGGTEYTMPTALGKDPKRYYTWVRLRHRKLHMSIVVVNTHLTHQGTTDGRPRPGMGDRTARFRAEIRTLRDFVGHFKYFPVIMTGDFNCDFRGDYRHRLPDFPRQMFASVGMKANWEILGTPKFPRGTIGPVLYDYIWRGNTQPWKVEFLGHSIMYGLGSDHHGLLVKMRLRPKPPPRRRTR